MFLCNFIVYFSLLNIFTFFLVIHLWACFFLGNEDEEVLDKSCIEVLGKLKHYTLGALKAWFMKNSEGDAGIVY